VGCFEHDAAFNNYDKLTRYFASPILSGVLFGLGVSTFEQVLPSIAPSALDIVPSPGASHQLVQQ
jgi:hypothetical protein